MAFRGNRFCNPLYADIEARVYTKPCSSRTPSVPSLDGNAQSTRTTCTLSLFCGSIYGASHHALSLTNMFLPQSDAVTLTMESISCDLGISFAGIVPKCSTSIPVKISRSNRQAYANSLHGNIPKDRKDRFSVSRQSRYSGYWSSSPGKEDVEVQTPSHSTANALT